MLAIAVLIRALDLFRLFDVVWALTSGGPGTMTETISIYAYVQGFQQFETSYAAAMAFAILLIVNRPGARWPCAGWRSRDEGRTAALGLALALRCAPLVALIVFLFPIYWLFAISFKTPEEIFAYPPVWWPSAVRLGNYLVLFQRRRRQDRRQQPGHRRRQHRGSPCSSARCAPTRSPASAPAATTSPCGS